MAMEGLEMEASFDFESNDDFCNSILSRFSNSTNEDHQHLCAVIGAMAQELQDQALPSTPLAYFGATCSSLDRISSEPDPSPHLLEALLTILSLLLPRISPPILNKKKDFLSDLLIRVLRVPSLTPTATTFGLKCVSHLVIVRNAVNWSDVSNLFGFILGFVIDSRPKVRRQSHICLRDVLLKLQGTSLLPSASEGVANVFEKSLLLAGGSNPKATEGPKGAQEVLFILEALKECLPLMSMKYITNILKYYKTLLELHQPVVTRRITDSLNSLCLHPTVDVSAEVLLDLLCSMAVSFSTSETSADGLAFTARLLNVGMEKVYKVNRQICVVKLPVVFNALKDIMLSDHEEAIYAAQDAMKNLISACIDEDMIRQGVTSENMEARKSGPSVIEKLCAITESLLDYHYTAVFDLAFQVVSAMFDKLGKYSSYFLKGALISLSKMQKLRDEDFPFRKELHECLGSALGAMGPQSFLDLVPFNLDTENLSEINTWLLPILKQYTVGAHLSYFTKTILGMIGEIKRKSQKLEQQGMIVSLRSMDSLVYSFWSLLPSFCNYPLDTAESFKDLQKALCIALNEEPDVRGIICASLQILIQQNKRVLEGKSDESDLEVGVARKLAMSHYTRKVAENNVTVLKSSSPELLSALSDIFLKSTKDGGYLQSTIGEISSISDKSVVSNLFGKTMRKLLKLTQEAAKVESKVSSNSMQIDDSTDASSPSFMRAQMYDLAVSFLPGLNSKEIDVLFVAVKSALKEQDCEGLIQKKAYKVLSAILKNSDEFLSTKFDELLTLMIEVLPLCHFSAKRHRLDCLYFLIVQVTKEDSGSRRHDIISSFLTEIILALKEANKKTRNRAYDILVQIGHACMDNNKGGKIEYLHQLFNMVAGGLGGETPHMISAAMKGLARLAYEFSDLVSAACNLLPSTFLLLQRKNREIIKANLGFLKVLVAKSKAEVLHVHLTSLVESLLKWQDGPKNHFKAKVKQLLEMLVRKCGLDAIKVAMPEEHMKLLTNIRKIRERKEKKLKSEGPRSIASKATTSRMSKWNHTRIFSEVSDDDETEDSGGEYLGGSDSEHMDGRKSRSSKASSHLRSKTSKRPKNRSTMNLLERLPDQMEDEPLDLLDQQRTRRALQSSVHLKRKTVLSDGEMKIDDEGRLIIADDDEPTFKRKPSNPDLDERSEVRSHLSVGSSKNNQKRRRTSDSGWAYTGTEYASKKAGGDVKRKDKLEPYAYWPLDRKMMSRRPEHRAAARKGMVSVVNMTKKLEGKSASSILSSKGSKIKKGHKKGSKKKVK
ncbi:RRP12-like protein isoform X2 [Benincasa hispida]|uniref:RRP12-like protein isoform X2 n=1 Tax=Benincasa hispida TaxID=102211 RepID=UPI0019015AB8|nr:RRP12-like protein isoform X2 [Benincasa hispida]